MRASIDHRSTRIFDPRYHGLQHRSLPQTCQKALAPLSSDPIPCHHEMKSTPGVPEPLCPKAEIPLLIRPALRCLGQHARFNSSW
ncbi:hypothetical protein DOTSEDRAFT_44804 [Dothistroma septosporum NZE10]|uniref:Uncharacterized protein n=1 Tax=Dothistroma septosporum (strain NZE10 / CBS 128990) TaxID=675120 RepID=N1PQM7_DOTSN|nr:hypothetical protein DOTSEDRAFT_44804 [Dothistroma septosporum NZE10]